MSRNKYLLQRKIFFYMIIFTLFIFFLLWFFQIAFLKFFYESTKKKEVISAINELREKYDGDNIKLFNSLENYAYEKGICSEALLNNNIEYTTNPLNKGCFNYYNKLSTVQEKENEFLNSSKTESILIIKNPLSDTKVFIYGIKINDSITIFSNTSIEPIDSTVNILKNQLIMITLLTIILASITAYIISRFLTKPISKLTKKSRELSSGNFNVNFDVHSDIIEIDELSKSLNYTKDVLKKNDDIRRDLMANVSHDLKTPLTMIKAYAEMVRDISYKNAEKRTNNLNVIVDEVDRLNLLVNDILELSKLENNMERTTYEEFDLVSLIAVIINRFKIFSITQDYEFIFLSPPNLIINADKSKMEQVIYNLIGNAINYSGVSKKIYITILLHKNIRVNISNTGVGIKKDDIDKIWDKYYKVEKKHQRSTIGTGLGLSIVKNIFELHGYKYGVISKEKKGTTFYFEIKKPK